MTFKVHDLGALVRPRFAVVEEVTRPDKPRLVSIRLISSFVKGSDADVYAMKLNQLDRQGVDSSAER